ncbi:MAG: DUF6786 family protein [Bacteroidota bacterium]
MTNTILSTYLTLLILIFMSCSSQQSTDQQSATIEESFAEGTYGYDLDFLQSNNISVHELVNESGARAMIVPGWQGRVMTSTSAGLKGKSYGWINYDFISSGERNTQFNPYGGEERFWLGPEGGPFSLYFAKGAEQVFDNWKVPEVLDTDPFDVEDKGDAYIRLKKVFSIENASGKKLDLEVSRAVSILNEDQVWKTLNINDLGTRPQSIAFESHNTIVNVGEETWESDYGFVSIWLLCMFNPSEQGVVFTKLNENQIDPSAAVKDDYFGKVPDDRLKVVDGVVYFKVDGKQRSKIGISPASASDYVGSYDPIDGILTVVWYEKLAANLPYVNSQWGEQDNPLRGDAINSYNDGPNETGEAMGPFYEIESSSPAALLSPGDKLEHKQRVYHIKAGEEELEKIISQLFNTSVSKINNVFNVD